MFVPAIDVIPEGSQSEHKIWRFNEQQEEAEDDWLRVRELAETGEVKTDRGGRVQVIAARLYETETHDRGAARQAVIDGSARILKDTEDALAGLPDPAKSLDGL